MKNYLTSENIQMQLIFCVKNFGDRHTHFGTKIEVLQVLFRQSWGKKLYIFDNEILFRWKKYEEAKNRYQSKKKQKVLMALRE
jgi:hypothetical protein